MVHLFDPLAETWTPLECSGISPQGLSCCSYTSEGHSLYIYGGEGIKGDYQSTLHKLDTLSCAWTLLSSRGPRKKNGCALVKFRNCLFLFGGYGDRICSTPQEGSEFEEGGDHGRGWTNELHTFDLTHGEGKEACRVKGVISSSFALPQWESSLSYKLQCQCRG
jgi:hypothetical protein